jgi:hypothetical protein
MANQHRESPLPVPLVPHSCFHCADVLLDFSTQESVEGSISVHDFYDISPNIALDRARQGCKFMSWAACKFLENEQSRPQSSARRLGLRIVGHRLQNPKATKGDLAGLELMWADQDEDYLPVDFGVSMSAFAYHGKQISPVCAIEGG